MARAIVDIRSLPNYDVILDAVGRVKTRTEKLEGVRIHDFTSKGQI